MRINSNCFTEVKIDDYKLMAILITKTNMEYIYSYLKEKKSITIPDSTLTDFNVWVFDPKELHCICLQEKDANTVFNL